MLGWRHWPLAGLFLSCGSRPYMIHLDAFEWIKMEDEMLLAWLEFFQLQLTWLQRGACRATLS